MGNKMAPFSKKKCSESVAGAMASFWADRMDYWYSLHLAGAMAGGTFTKEQLAAAPQPHTVVALLSKLPDHHPGWERLPMLSTLQPKLAMEGGSSSSASK